MLSTVTVHKYLFTQVECCNHLFLLFLKHQKYQLISWMELEMELEMQIKKKHSAEQNKSK